MAWSRNFFIGEDSLGSQPNVVPVLGSVSSAMKPSGACCRDDVTTLSQSAVNEVSDLLTNSVKDLALTLRIEGHVKDNGHLLHCCPFLLVIVARVVVPLLAAPS